MRADARAKRRDLIDAAWALFSQRGVDVSLRSVAAHAGVGIGTLYRHFPTREDLVVGVADEALRRILEVIAQHSDGWDGAADQVWRNFVHALSALELGALFGQIAPFAEHSPKLTATTDDRRRTALDSLGRIFSLAKRAKLLRHDIEELRFFVGLAAISRPVSKQADAFLPDQRGWLVDVFVDGLAPTH